ncbi:MAG: glycosyltransferase family 4 protein [Dehalococcoidia bacterium]
MSENGRSGAWRVGFVMEQTLGHRSHSQTLGWGAERDPEVEALWLPVDYDATGLPWSLPLVRHNWSLRGSLKARWGIGRLARGPIDALFIHTFTITLFAGRYLDRIPTVLSMDATPENYDQVGSWYGHKVQPRALEALKRALRRRVLRKAAAVVTWCDWARRSLIDDYGLDGDRIHVIPPGAEIENFRFGVRSKENGVERPVRLLFVGGDFDRKGGRILLHAYRAGLRDRAELHLVTQEDVPEERGVFVHRGLTSNSPELLSLYEQADVFVLPTLGDCFPVVMGEAMAAGLPIVTTDVGALPEAVADGRNGFVIPAGDDVALVSALDVLIRNRELRLDMGIAGRRIAEDRFDSRRNAARVLEALKAVCLRQAVAQPEAEVVST